MSRQWTQEPGPFRSPISLFPYLAASSTCVPWREGCSRASNKMKHVFMLASLGMFGIGCSAAEPRDEREAAQAQAIVEEPGAAMAHPSCTYGVERWGRFDQAGQSNTQTPGKMLEAAAFIRPSSKSISL